MEHVAGLALPLAQRRPEYQQALAELEKDEA